MATKSNGQKNVTVDAYSQEWPVATEPEYMSGSNQYRGDDPLYPDLDRSMKEAHTYLFDAMAQAANIQHHNENQTGIRQQAQIRIALAQSFRSLERARMLLDNQPYGVR